MKRLTFIIVGEDSPYAAWDYGLFVRRKLTREGVRIEHFLPGGLMQSFWRSHQMGLLNKNAILSSGLPRWDYVCLDEQRKEFVVWRHDTGEVSTLCPKPQN